MKEYKLKVLMVTSAHPTDDQYKEFTVEAEGYNIVGDGSVYQFFVERGNSNSWSIVASYPTQYTIIENIIKLEDEEY